MFRWAEGPEASELLLKTRISHAPHPQARPPQRRPPSRVGPGHSSLPALPAPPSLARASRALLSSAQRAPLLVRGSPSSSAISKPCNRHREAQRCPFSNLLIGSPFVIFRIGAPGSRARTLPHSRPPALPGQRAEPRSPQQAPEGSLWGALGDTKGWGPSIRSQGPDRWGQTGEGCLPFHFTSPGLWG